jgi:hypothetical protein
MHMSHNHDPKVLETSTQACCKVFHSFNITATAAVEQKQTVRILNEIDRLNMAVDFMDFHGSSYRLNMKEKPILRM